MGRRGLAWRIAAAGRVGDLSGDDLAALSPGLTRRPDHPGLAAWFEPGGGAAGEGGGDGAH